LLRDDRFLLFRGQTFGQQVRFREAVAQGGDLGGLCRECGLRGGQGLSEAFVFSGLLAHRDGHDRDQRQGGKDAGNDPRLFWHGGQVNQSSRSGKDGTVESAAGAP
jgi:hypothetical protein